MPTDRDRSRSSLVAAIVKFGLPALKRRFMFVIIKLLFLGKIAIFTIKSVNLLLPVTSGVVEPATVAYILSHSGLKRYLVW